MNFLRQQALEQLRFDPIQTAEEMTGSSVDESKATQGLAFGMHIAGLKRQRMLLGELGDTHHMISWKEFLEIIAEYGFEIVVIRQFAYDGGGYDSKVEYPTLIIAAHRTKKLLLHATSYISCGSERLNNGNVYGAIDKEELTFEEYCQALDGVDAQDAYDGEGTKGFEIDARYGLISKLELLEGQVQFVDWHQQDRFLWLLDYVEAKVKEGDLYQERRDEFLATAPSWVRDFIV